MHLINATQRFSARIWAQAKAGGQAMLFGSADPSGHGVRTGMAYAFAAMLCLAMAATALFATGFASPEKATAAAAQDMRGVHLGVASCAGSTCHGRSVANTPEEGVVRQDELLRWQEESSPSGAHSRAYRVLREPRGIAIGKRLGVDSGSAQMCLGCHATPAGQRGGRFQVNDGVGCESCHGPASGWLASHYSVGATHARNVSQGLVPLDNPATRARVCLDCHLGSEDAGQFVTHRIMAAGHPRISFELDLFSTLQQHHDEDADYAKRNKTGGNALRMWAVGQAEALSRSLNLFSKPGLATEGIFPEFYFYDCHSCHRRIFDGENARPTKLANPGRPIPPGMPPYNDENLIMLSAAVKVLAPDMAGQFDSRAKAFHAAMAQGRAPAVQAAASLRQTTMALSDRFAGASFTRAQAFTIMETIAGDAISPRFTDYEGAVQSVMAIDTLLNALVNQGAVSEGSAKGLRVQINQAYAAVNEPNSFDPAQFRRALGGAVRTIRTLK